MKKFAISEKDIKLLEAKFKEFQDTRNTILMSLVSYISDYQKYYDSSSNDKDKSDGYLQKKYSWHTLKINYLFNSGSGFYWSIRNIAIVLGRNRSSITRIINKMKNSYNWRERLSALHKSVKSDSGFSVDVYHQDIFDLILDYYEEGYLLRFTEHRHRGEKTSQDIHDINELHRFWDYLKSMESVQKSVFVPEELEIMLPFGWYYRIKKSVIKATRAILKFLKEKIRLLVRPKK